MAGRTSEVYELCVFWVALLLLAVLYFPAEATWDPECVLLNITSINGQRPAPTVKAREGDTVVFHLEDVVIRWQGMRQMSIHYGLQRSVVFYGSVMVNTAYKEPFSYNCQLSTSEQATQFFGDSQLDGITAGRQNSASDTIINKWSQFAELESFTMMGTTLVNGAAEKSWTGLCFRVNIQGKLLKRQLLPQYHNGDKGHGAHHN